MSDEQQTCGKGLAAHAPLPRALAEVMAAVGAVLDLHTIALDPADPIAEQELETYRRLVEQHRDVADALRAIADEMAGARDLPMAPHDMVAMTDPRHAEAFSRLIEEEEELMSLLQTRLESDRAMLPQMRAGSG